MRVWRSLLVSLFCVAGAAPASAHPPSARPAAGAASDFVARESFDGLVTRVIEADLLVVRPIGSHAPAGEQHVYLIGSDTPEAGQGAWTNKARDHVRGLTEGKRVRLTLDQGPRANCGPLRAYVHTADGRFLNLDLVRGGWAEVLSKKPNLAHDAEFKQAEAIAKAARLGIWATAGGLAAVPSEYRHTHGKAEVTGQHGPGCKH